MPRGNAASFASTAFPKADVGLTAPDGSLDEGANKLSRITVISLPGPKGALEDTQHLSYPCLLKVLGRTHPRSLQEVNLLQGNHLTKSKKKKKKVSVPHPKN
ncbi:hypothetical protein HPB48_009077 [Haemaphysalis longicornis]|uniref:Uncharacterized protein n=1 Tax=Haemaphysalis longicornis TaxID=44386 RepID=A0A9J6FXJ2_HAELO|nr:hypothetical protein HPB48_009077 [Haemaphysalis longicornis]